MDYSIESGNQAYSLVALHSSLVMISEFHSEAGEIQYDFALYEPLKVDIL